MCKVLDGMVGQCFPFVTIKHKSTDNPWVTRKDKRQIRRRRRIYRREGKSDKWHEEKKITEDNLNNGKKKWFGKMKKKSIDSGNNKSYFQAAKTLGCKEAPVQFNVRTILPGKADAAIVEELAEYQLNFNGISPA